MLQQLFNDLLVFSVYEHFFIVTFFFQGPKGLVTFTRQTLNNPPDWERYCSLFYYVRNFII